MFSDHLRDHCFHYSLEYSSSWNLELRDIRPPPKISSKLASSHVLHDQIYVWKESVLVTQSCLTLSDPMDCSRQAPLSVHGILQARILEWVAIPSSRGPSWIGNRTWVSCTADGFFTVWATREAQVIQKTKTITWINEAQDTGRLRS